MPSTFLSLSRSRSQDKGSVLRLSCERAPNARLRWLLRPRKIATSLQCSGIFGRGGTLLLILLLLLTDDVIITVRTSADDPIMVFALASVGRDTRAGEDRVVTCLVLPPTTPLWWVGGLLSASLRAYCSTCQSLQSRRCLHHRRTGSDDVITSEVANTST